MLSEVFGLVWMVRGRDPSRKQATLRFRNPAERWRPKISKHREGDVDHIKLILCGTHRTCEQTVGLGNWTPNRHGNMSSSEEEASIGDERWDDMAVVRAFEDAMQGKRREQKKPVNGKQSGSSRRKRADGRRRQSTESVPESHDGASRLEATYQDAQYTAHHPQTQEQIYQAAYAQAYAHLQGQWQSGNPYAFSPYQQHQPPTGFVNPHQQPGFPGQWTQHAPPTPPMMPFPAVPGQIPTTIGAGGSQDDLANLLLSWYQSGYYTGRYQAMQEMRSKGRQ